MRGETSWMMFQASAEPGMANQRRPQHENCGDLDSVGGNHPGVPRRQGAGGKLRRVGSTPDCKEACRNTGKN